MPSNLEEKVNHCLVAANLTMPQLAEKMGLSEPELTTLCRHGDPRLSELEQLAKCLSVDALYFMGPVKQQGAFNIAGNGNIQKIKISKGAARQLAAQMSIVWHTLDMANRLVAAKQEIIDLLLSSYNGPN